MKYNLQLRRLRESLKLSQEDVGRYLGVTRSAVSAIEVGKNTISVSILIKLSKLFNVSTDYLLGLSNDKINTDKTIDVSSLSNQEILALRQLIYTFKSDH